MQRTVSLKLLDPPIDDLRCTMNAFRNACAYLSASIQKGAPVNRGRLHRLYYQILRKQFELPSQMAQSAIRVVVGAYRSKRANGDKGDAPTFSRPQVQFQYNRDWSFSQGLVSLRTLTARRRLQFRIGLYQLKKYLDDLTWKFGGARLVERKGTFYINITVKKVSPEPNEAVTPIGIDRGIRYLTVARVLGKKPLIVPGGNLTDYRNRMFRLRRRLQAKGTRSARRVLRHLRRREKRFVLDFCRQTAKQIIQYTLRINHPVLVFEELMGIRGRVRSRNRKSRRYLHTWPFLVLKRILMGKAEELGVPVVSVNPAYTSQKCPRCGTISKHHRRRDNYHCKICNYQNNADVVAATNIAWLWPGDVDRIGSGVPVNHPDVPRHATAGRDVQATDFNRW